MSPTPDELRNRLRAALDALRRSAWGDALAAEAPPVWLVGGALRDLAVGRAARDVDFAAPRGRALALGRAVAERLGARYVVLHEDFGACRVVLPASDWLDFTDLQADDIEADLRRRDLTVNALGCAWPDGDALLDPTGGLRDLADRVARRAAPGVLRADPVRVLRVFRFAAEFDLTVDADTLAEAKEAAPLLAGMPGERVWEELRALLAHDRCREWLTRLDEAGALDALCPDLAAGAGLTQPDFHHLDIRAHAIEAAKQVDELLAEPLFGQALAAPADRALLRLAALLHDIGKPAAATVDENRTRYPGHAARGARLAEKTAARLRLSRAETRRLSGLIAAHMRPHQLAELYAGQRLTRRACRRFFLDLRGDWRLCLALARADLRATAGPGAPPEGEARAERLAQFLAGEAAVRLRAMQTPLLRGEDVVAAGVAPGPAVGRLLARLAEARFDDPTMTRDHALALLRQWAADDERATANSEE